MPLEASSFASCNGSPGAHRCQHPCKAHPWVLAALLLTIMALYAEAQRQRDKGFNISMPLQMCVAASCRNEVFLGTATRSHQTASNHSFLPWFCDWKVSAFVSHGQGDTSCTTACLLDGTTASTTKLIRKKTHPCTHTHTERKPFEPFSNLAIAKEWL